ncbi:MAG: hypothetical protein L3J79_09190 [Candidatus Marinimicrobia bacterium]|nr:hypothetical protein [Candidatus Neomarinimicrobiota bacterium]
MDNIGPIALFILYMAISAWAKKNKAQRKAAQKESGVTEASDSNEASFMGGIFEKLKNELLEAEEEPQFIPYESPLMEPEPVIDESVPRFVEGSGSLQGDGVLTSAPIDMVSDVVVSPLEKLLEPYSRIEQGILLHEILGKPRAYQDNDDWFHKS